MNTRQRTVLVTDAGRGCAIACLRSLGSKGWHVIAADSDPRSAGFRSRYASERFVYPSPRQSPSAFVDAVRELAARRTIDLVIPVTDDCVHPLAHARTSFPAATQLAIAPDEALAKAADKLATSELARSLGIAVPRTRVVRTLDEARRAAAELTFPLVIKPSISRRHLRDADRIEVGAVTFARDLAQLEKRFSTLAEKHTILLQEYRHGVGVGVECLARDGQVLRAFQHKRLAEIPISGGASAWRESTALDPALLEQSRALIAALRWTGLIMVEFKLGDQPWFVEINGRIWGSLPLACLAGVDFPGELARLYYPDVEPPHNGKALHDGQPEHDGKLAAAQLLRGAPGYRVGLRAYNLELMLSWIGQVLIGRARHDYLPRPGRERALAGLFSLLDPTQKSDLSGAGDPAPRMAEAARIVRNFSRKLWNGRVES